MVLLREEETVTDLAARIDHFKKEAQGLELPKVAGERRELRTYGLGSQILADLGVRKMRVMGHKLKVPAMSGFGLEIVEYIDEVADKNSNKKVSG